MNNLFIIITGVLMLLCWGVGVLTGYYYGKKYKEVETHG